MRGDTLVRKDLPCILDSTSSSPTAHSHFSSLFRNLPTILSTSHSVQGSYHNNETRSIERGSPFRKRDFSCYLLGHYCSNSKHVFVYNMARKGAFSHMNPFTPRAISSNSSIYNSHFSIRISLLQSFIPLSTFFSLLTTLQSLFSPYISVQYRSLFSHFSSLSCLPTWYSNETSSLIHAS